MSLGSHNPLALINCLKLISNGTASQFRGPYQFDAWKLFAQPSSLTLKIIRYVYPVVQNCATENEATTTMSTRDKK